MDTRRAQFRSKDMPELSASVDSATSEDYDRLARSRSHSPNVRIKGLSSGKSSMDSLSVSKGRGKHTTSQVLEKMVISIKETKITHRDGMAGLPASVTDALPLSIHSADCLALTTSNPPQAPAQSSPRRHSEQRASQSSGSSSTVPLSSPESAVVRSQTYGSDTSAELIASHSVVRGFDPNKISSSQRSHTYLSPIPSPRPIKQVSRPIIQELVGKGGFILGGSSGEDSSIDDQMSLRPKSSLTAGLRRSPTDKKTTSFKEEVESRTIANRSHEDEDVFESDDDEEDEEDDDDEEDVSESAIEEDEDESDWEDDATDSGVASPTDKHLFQRVDSKPNLVSRRSLLTTMMHQSDRANAMASLASKSQPMLRSRTSTPNGPSVAGTPEEEAGLEMQGTAISRSKPIVMNTSSLHPPTLSPRTTRRNMLAQELTSSLRRHLLHERQQKSTVVNAALKRRHTAHDMANLKNYPEPSGSGNGSKNNSWNHYFDHGLGEYHSKGW